MLYFLHYKGALMKLTMKIGIASGLTLLALNGCLGPLDLGNGAQAGTATGAVTGAVIGANTKGHKKGRRMAIGTTIGAIVGGIIGNTVDNNNQQPQQTGGWQ